MSKVPQVGQIWRSRDRRDNMREVKITRIDNGYAYVVPVNPPVYAVRLDRLKPTSNGFELVHPASIDIAQLAYAMFLDRGSVHGRDVEDWLAAEEVLLS
jgi:hypothetical protein